MGGSSTAREMLSPAVSLVPVYLKRRNHGFKVVTKLPKNTLVVSVSAVKFDKISEAWRALPTARLQVFLLMTKLFGFGTDCLAANFQSANSDGLASSAAPVRGYLG